MGADEEQPSGGMPDTGAARPQAGIPETTALTSKKAVTGYGSSSTQGGGKLELEPVSGGVTGIPYVCWFILAVELCERLCFYTFQGSQAFFLEHLGYGTAESSKINATMWTLCTVLAIVASWIADVALGRYQTILLAGSTYFLGTLLASIAAIPTVESAALYFIGMLVLVPFGTAGIKANISNFGADQYNDDDPASKAAQERFFSVFYFSINVGSGLAFGFFTTFATNGGVGVPKRFGYFAAYIIMTGCMLLAMGIFRLGRSGYRVHPLQENSALVSVFSSLHENIREGNFQAFSVCAGAWLLLATVVLSTIKGVADVGDGVMYSAFVTAGLGALAIVIPCLNPSWLGSRRAEGPTQTEQEVQGFLRVLPVLFAGNLCFGALYNSMQFWYQLQACQMDLRVGGNGFQLSGSFFNIADCLAIVICTPICVDWINPMSEKVLGRQMTPGTKFGIGVLIASISVVIAARLEQMRRNSDVLVNTSNCAPPGIVMSSLSASWMLVPFFLMGIGEIYAQPMLMHFAYSKSPPSMRTLATAGSFFIQGVASALFAVLVEALSRYITNDLNQGHLEFGYYANLVIGAVFYLIFVAVMQVAP